MAQLGQSARLGAVRSQVRILLPRFQEAAYRSFTPRRGSTNNVGSLFCYLTES